ncbi:hypothetical protein QUA35_25750 [Microcoleus sp. N9_B2]
MVAPTLVDGWLTYPSYRGMGILSSQGFRRIYLQESITGGMPYGCKSSN